MRSDDKIKDIFSSKLGNSQPQVPDSVWAGIEKELSIGGKHAHSKKFYLFRISSIAASVAAVILLCWLLIKPSDNADNKQILVGTSAETTKSSGSANDVLDDIDKKLKNSQTGNILQNSNISGKYNTNKIVASISRNDLKESGIDSDGISVKVFRLDVQEQSNNKSVEQAVLSMNKRKDDAKLKELENMFSGKEKTVDKNLFSPEKVDEKRYALSVGGFSGITSENNKNTKVQNSVPYVKNMEALLSDSKLEVVNLITEPVDMKHKQPVSFGVTVSKKINKKFSVETGIVYTYLSSDIKSKKNSESKRDDSQYFHYLGVPLNFNYNFAEWGKADFYVSVGGMIQKDVYGRLKTYRTKEDEDSKKGVSLNEDISQKNPQFSLKGTVGVSYPLVDKLNAYATVGGAYYLDANNKHKTIYSDRKFQLDLNLGLKLEF
ncbi:MAG: hypothetical protein ACLVKO_03235 [Dysgonomonas sp.]